MSQPSTAARPSYRRIITASSTYSLVMFAQRAASIILLPVYTRYLTPADYGVLELLDLLSSVISVVVGIRIGQALFYYYYSPGEHSPSSYVASAMIGSFLIGILVSGLGFIMAPLVSQLIFGTHDYARHVQVFFVGFAFTLPLEAGWCYLRVTDRPQVLVVLSICRIIAMFVLNVLLLVAFQIGVFAILWGTAISTIGVAAYLMWHTFSTIPLRFERPVTIKLLRFSVPLGLSALAETMLHFGDRIFLRTSVPLSALGLYGLAYKLGMVVPSISTPFFMYWNSQMVGIVRQPGGEKMYVRMATYLILGLTGVTLLLVFFSHPVLALMTTPEFRPAAQFVPWIALAYLIRAVGAYCSNTFLLEKQPGLMAQVTVAGAAVCLAGYALLIPKHGVWGAIIATMMGFTSMAVLALWRSQRLRHFDYEYGRWAKIASAAAISAAAWYVLNPSGLWMEIGAGTLLFAGFVLLLMLTGVIEPEERAEAWRLLQLAKQRLSRAHAAVTPSS